MFRREITRYVNQILDDFNRYGKFSYVYFIIMYIIFNTATFHSYQLFRTTEIPLKIAFLKDDNFNKR